MLSTPQLEFDELQNTEGIQAVVETEYLHSLLRPGPRPDVPSFSFRGFRELGDTSWLRRRRRRIRTCHELFGQDHDLFAAAEGIHQLHRVICELEAARTTVGSFLEKDSDNNLAVNVVEA